VREWVERRSTTEPTLTRRCAPASPCQGEASFLCRETARCKPSLRRTKRRRLLSLALARARERMKGEGVGRTSMHDDRIHFHPALRAGLSLPGRGVFSLPCNCDVQTVTSVAPSDVDSSPSPWLGRGRGSKVREWVERRSTTQPTLTRRCAPASPCQGEASLCCFVGNRRQLSVRFLNGANPTGTQCRGDPVGRPWGAVYTGGRVR